LYNFFLSNELPTMRLRQSGNLLVEAITLQDLVCEMPLLIIQLNLPVN